MEMWALLQAAGHYNLDIGQSLDEELAELDHLDIDRDDHNDHNNDLIKKISELIVFIRLLMFHVLVLLHTLASQDGFYVDHALW